MPSMEQCPSCGQALELNPGYVTWCDQCDWNLHPDREQIKTKTSIYDKLNRSVGPLATERLFRKQMEHSGEGRSRRFSACIGVTFHNLRVLDRALCHTLSAFEPYTKENSWTQSIPGFVSPA